MLLQLKIAKFLKINLCLLFCTAGRLVRVGTFFNSQLELRIMGRYYGQSDDFLLGFFCVLGNILKHVQIV